MKSTKLLLLIGVLSFIVSHAYSQKAQEPFDIDLWENGYPNTNGHDHLPPDESTWNHKPSMRVFLPNKDVATGRAVVACPGGAYIGLAYHHEGYDWAPFFNEQGIALIVLKYRMPKGVNKDVPYSDAEEALRIVRENAAKWNINPSDVGIMGSSAGGHLATTISTHAKPEVKPNFQILFYPVVSMEDTYTHKESKEMLLGKKPSKKLVKNYSNEKRVTKETPRAFIAYSDDDSGVPTPNGVNYYLALKENGVPASLYIYPSGGHGWGARSDFQYHNEMIADLKAWLKSF